MLACYQMLNRSRKEYEHKSFIYIFYIFHMDVLFVVGNKSLWSLHRAGIDNGTNDPICLAVNIHHVLAYKRY